MLNDLAKRLAKLHQPRMFGGKGRSGEIGHFAVMLMQAEARSGAGSPREVPVEVIFGKTLIERVGVGQMGGRGAPHERNENHGCNDGVPDFHGAQCNRANRSRKSMKGLRYRYGRSGKAEIS